MGKQEYQLLPNSLSMTRKKDVVQKESSLSSGCVLSTAGLQENEEAAM